MGRRLYVGNLPYQTTDEDLNALFSQAGAVETVRVMRDMATGRARGFAFVEMATDEQAATAIQNLNGRDLQGRPVTINEARERTGGGGGGFGGGAGGFGGGGGGGARRAGGGKGERW